MATINLLPWREDAKRQRQNQFNMMAGFSFFAAAIIAVLAYFVIEEAIALQVKKNEYVKQEIRLTEERIKQIKDLRESKDNLKKRMDLIERLQNTRNLTTHLFDNIASVVSPGLYLESVTRKGNSIWIKGLAESNNHFANMLRNVENSQWLRNPLVQKINVEDITQRKLNKFDLRVDVNTTLNKEKK